MFNLKGLLIAIVLLCEVTAYTYTGYTTALGKKPRPGIVAVDPKVIKMGSTVIINGKKYKAADVHGKKGKVVDIFMASRKEAVRFGRKKIKVRVEKG